MLKDEPNLAIGGFDRTSPEFEQEESELRFLLNGQVTLRALRVVRVVEAVETAFTGRCTANMLCPGLEKPLSNFVYLSIVFHKLHETCYFRISFLVF